VQLFEETIIDAAVAVFDNVGHGDTGDHDTNANWEETVA
jgi:hypothetical protein